MTSRDAVTLPSTATTSDRQDAPCDLTHAKRMAALGELAGGITHDFRNILQTVISNLDLLEARSGDPAEVRRLTASALRAAERGISLTKRLLPFSHHKATQFAATCLVSSLESVTETLGRTIGVRVNVQIDPPPADLWQAVLDSHEFELALINLGFNARDAMPNGGCLRLGARNVSIPAIDRRKVPLTERPDLLDRRGPRLALRSGDYVAVSVTDTGTGMDAATLARATEPFFTTKPIGKGTGLGLSIAHTLAVHAGGTLRLMSQPGQGTTVEMWLSRATPLIGVTTRSVHTHTLPVHEHEGSIA